MSAVKSMRERGEKSRQQAWADKNVLRFAVFRKTIFPVFIAQIMNMNSRLSAIFSDRISGKYYWKLRIIIDILKNIFIFASVYIFGRTSKSKHLFPKRDACFFYYHLTRGYYNKDSCSLIFSNLSMYTNENKPTSCDSRHWSGDYQTCQSTSLQASTFRQGWKGEKPPSKLLG